MTWIAATFWLLLITTLFGVTRLDGPNEEPVTGLASEDAPAAGVIPQPTPLPGQQPTYSLSGAVSEDRSEFPWDWSVEEIKRYICTFPWPCEEALMVAGTESRFRADVFNWEGSGACGLFQVLPCPCVEVTCNVGHALAKWEDQDGIQDNGIGGFERHWYRFWK